MNLFQPQPSSGHLLSRCGRRTGGGGTANGKGARLKPDVSWGHEPGRWLQSGTGCQPVSPEQARCLCHFLRFMGSSHDFEIAHRGQEPATTTFCCICNKRLHRWRGRFMGSFHDLTIAHPNHEPPLTRPPATLSPSDGEREGVRGVVHGALKSPNKKGQACACPFLCQSRGTNYGLTSILVGGLKTMILPPAFREAWNVSVTFPVPVRTYF